MQLSTYQAIYASIYDIGSERSHILDFYIKHCEAAAPPVLEPMCGTGHFLIACMERGIDIDGMDASPGMLAVCRKKCEAQGLQPNLYEQRMEALDLPRQYGHVIIPDGSFTHLYDKTVASASLQRLYDHMLPGATLMLDIAGIPQTQEETGTWKAQVTECPASRILSSSLWMYKENGRVLHVIHKQERFVDGRLVDTELNDYISRYYDQAEFTHMLEQAGFIDIQVTKGYEDNTKPDEEDQKVFRCRVPA